MLEIVATHGLKLKITKSHFAEPKLEILGHVVDEAGIHVSMKKIQAIRETPLPAMVTQLRSFVRLAGYYRPFIKGVAEMSSP